MANALTNEIRLKKLVGDAPLVTGDEKIAVFGAGGQIGTKLKPFLDKLYPGQVLYCDNPGFAETKNMQPLDITDEEAVRGFIRRNKVKAVINLAALLSAAAEKDPAKALKINFYMPLTLMNICKEEGVRKLQMMSSMAAQEFDNRRDDTPEMREIRKTLQNSASTSIVSVPDGSYGLSKLAQETAARMFSLMPDTELDISIPRLAGVLNAHTPWPSNGTTEELDKLIVAAAMQEVYPENWQEKLAALIGPDGLKNGHYLRDGKYIPEVEAKAVFDMVDGKTLPEAVLMLMHQNLRGQHGVAEPGPVHNVSEYSVSMQEAADVLKKLNPHFTVEFATSTENGLDRGKVTRSKIWPASQNTKSTENLIGDFKQYTAEQSISENYKRVVAALKQKRASEMAVTPSARAAGTSVAAAS